MGWKPRGRGNRLLILHLTQFWPLRQGPRKNQVEESRYALLWEWEPERFTRCVMTSGTIRTLRPQSTKLRILYIKMVGVKNRLVKKSRDSEESIENLVCKCLWSTHVQIPELNWQSRLVILNKLKKKYYPLKLKGGNYF